MSYTSLLNFLFATPYHTLIAMWFNFASGYKKIKVMMLSSRKRKSFDTLHKLKAAECAEKSSKEVAAREFKADSKRIRVWCSQKEQMIVLKKDRKLRRKRLAGPGRKPRDVEMEEALFGRTVDLHGRHLCVSPQMIRMQARVLCVSTDEDFKPSQCWLDHVMK